MTDMELLDILGGVRGKYILKPSKCVKAAKKRPASAMWRQLAAVIALILMLAIFLNTAPGAGGR